MDFMSQLALEALSRVCHSTQGLLADPWGHVWGSLLRSPEEKVCFSKNPPLCTSPYWQSCWRSQDLSRALGLV